MRRALVLAVLALVSLAAGASAGTVVAASPAPAMSLANAPQIQSLTGVGIPAPEWKSACTATQYCADWLYNISCSGTSSCTVGATSVTCDGSTTHCFPGTCAPIATGCVAIGNEVDWCECVRIRGNTIQARVQCSKELCF